MVIISQNNAAAEQEEHNRHVAICEGNLADPYGEDFEAMIECLERLDE